MNGIKFSTGVFLAVLLFVSLACSTLGGLAPDEDSLVATAQSAATQAVNLATEIQSEDLVATAQALVTEVSEEDLQATAEAFAEGVDTEGMIATANAIATEAAVEGGELAATAQTLATQISGSEGEVPEDIPIPDTELDEFFASANLVSYSIAWEFDEVLAFYQNELPANGWTESAEGTVISPAAAVLVYQQVGKTATVSIGGIPFTGTTIVQILIQGS